MIKDNCVRKAFITNTIDGDTVDAIVYYSPKKMEVERLRFLGVNTPERGRDGYFEATEFTANHIEGRFVDIQCDDFKKDSFGRLLATVFYTEGDMQVNLNNQLLSENLAVVYTKK